MEDTTKTIAEFNQRGGYKKSTTAPFNILKSTERETITYDRITTDQIQVTTTKTKDGAFVSQDQVTQAGQLPGPKKVGTIQNDAGMKFKKIAVNK